jgi:hypothetical protein
LGSRFSRRKGTAHQLFFVYHLDAFLQLIGEVIGNTSGNMLKFANINPNLHGLVGKHGGDRQIGMSFGCFRHLWLPSQLRVGEPPDEASCRLSPPENTRWGEWKGKSPWRCHSQGHRGCHGSSHTHEGS